MSAFGYKQTFSGQLANVRFTPNSGHSEAQERLGLKKRTFNVCLTPNSGHAEVRTFGGSAVAAVPGRSAQISPQGDPIAAGVEGPLRRPGGKFRFGGCRPFLKRSGSSAEDGRANPAVKKIKIHVAGMSALPPIADINAYSVGCPLLTQSGSSS